VDAGRAGIAGSLHRQEYEFRQGPDRLCFLPEGKFEPLTNDTNNYSTLSLSGDGRTLTTIQSQRESELDLLPAAGGGAGGTLPG